jgi:hypothetical protein
VGFAAASDGLARPSPTTTVTAANASKAVGGCKSCWQGSWAQWAEDNAAVNGVKFHRVSSFSDAVVAEEHKGQRGVAVGGARAGHVRALERRVARREKPAWGRNPGVITVQADSPLNRHFDYWRTFIHLNRWNSL